MYQANVNVNSIVENVTQTKIEKTVNVSESIKIQKNIVCEKKIIYGILLNVLAKIVNM